MFFQEISVAAPDRICCQKSISRSPLSKEELIAAYHRGQEEGATHMLIVWDTYDFRDSYEFVVYCNPSEDVNTLIQHYSAPGFYRVSTVFALDLDLDEID